MYNKERMPQLTVRNLPEELVRALRIRAARNGRSAEAEHRMILAQALRSAESDFWTRADAMRATTRPQKSDSARLLREMRDSR
jgi:plasmid stability protein